MKTIEWKVDLLSKSGLKELEKKINKISKTNLIAACTDAINKLSKEGMKDNYSDVVQDFPSVDGDKVKGGFHTTEGIDIFKEFGTGVVGQNAARHPKLPEGWQHNTRNQKVAGIGGWFYPKENGEFGITSGQEPKKKFYEAELRIEEQKKRVFFEEIEKLLNE